MFPSEEFSNGSADRGQSEVIGVVLLLSITVVVVTAISASGAGVLGEAQTDSRIAQTENSMSQMSSKAGLVALGESEAYTFVLGNLGDGMVDVREDAGSVTITHVYTEEEEEEEDELYEGEYGAVIAAVGNTEIAYQGGGIWRKDGDRSVMVSPPEYHYRSNTLTFPVVRVTGDGRASGVVTGRFTSAGTSTSIYPDASENRTNPLQDGEIIITVQSEYYDAWYRFFDDRTDGNVEIDHESKTVSAELTVPTETEIDNAVAVSTPNGITTNGDDKPDPYREGIKYPSASSLIDEEVTTCEAGDCTTITSETTTITGEIGEENRYYATGEYAPENLAIETNGEEIKLVVNGTFEPEELVIDGDGEVSVYVTGGFSIGDNAEINADGSSSQLIVYVHSNAADISTQRGTPTFTGLLYAPNTDIELSGNTVFTGALIAETLHINGNAGNFEYGLDENVTIDVGAGQTPIRYLHVTENEISVELR
jgi:flagellin-like protein